MSITMDDGSWDPPSHEMMMSTRAMDTLSMKLMVYAIHQHSSYPWIRSTVYAVAAPQAMAIAIAEDACYPSVFISRVGIPNTNMMKRMLIPTPPPMVETDSILSRTREHTANATAGRSIAVVYSPHSAIRSMQYSRALLSPYPSSAS